MESFEENFCMFNDINGSEPLEELWLSEQTSDSEEDQPQRTIDLYWESQLALLREILERHKISGLKLREEVGRMIKKIKASDYCICFKPNYYYCPNCLRTRVATMLCDKGFTTNICTSKWKPTDQFPGGSHEYIEVIATTTKRMNQIRFLIELELKEQFQIPKAGEEYQKLVSCLPEFYVGKADYLAAIVRVVCDSAKKSMKEKKMYLGPWRKSKFMQMKWSGFNPTYHNHTQGIESIMNFSGTPNALVAVN